MVDLKSWNLIGCDHFGLYLRNKIFIKYRICAATQQLIQNFIKEQIQTIFGPFPQFFGQKVFPKNLALTCTTRKGF